MRRKRIAHAKAQYRSRTGSNGLRIDRCGSSQQRQYLFTDSNPDVAIATAKIKVADDRRLDRSLDRARAWQGLPTSRAVRQPLPLAFESRPQIATARCTSLLSTHVVAGYTRAVAADLLQHYLGPDADHPLQNSRSNHRLQLHRNAPPRAILHLPEPLTSPYNDTGLAKYTATCNRIVIQQHDGDTGLPPPDGCGVQGQAIFAWVQRRIQVFYILTSFAPKSVFSKLSDTTFPSRVTRIITAGVSATRRCFPASKATQIAIPRRFARTSR